MVADTHSCTHFLTDLFSQWLAAAGQHTPLVVLTSAVRAMLAISDLFTQDAQFRWMLDCLAELWRLHPVEDELLQELLILGTAKAVAVVGCPAEPDTIDRLRKGVEAGLRSGQPSTRLAAVHALLYLLQRDTEGGGEGVWQQLARDHVRANMMAGGGAAVTQLTGSDQLTLAQWALVFYTLENCTDCATAEQLAAADSWPQLTAELVGVAVLTAGHHQVSRPVYTTVLAGLERLVVAGVVRSPSPQLDQIVKLATDLMTDWPPSAVLPATQLFLAAMYSSHSHYPDTQLLARPSPITEPETLMLMMEQMSILFDCVRRCGPAQAELLAELLPQVLLDFFPAGDVVNRVISEFISPGQPHPALLAGVLRHIFRAAASQDPGPGLPDQQNMLTEWVLVSLPNFTRRAPLSYSIWCLSCFFLAASPNPWLQVTLTLCM